MNIDELAYLGYLDGCRIVSKAQKRPSKRFHQEWVQIGEAKNFYRSKWEIKYARYLQFLKTQKMIANWIYEPKIFWFDGIKRGCVSYKPDFLVEEIDGSHYWVEVKGYMDKKSATKIKRFRKYFPHEILFVIEESWFKDQSKKFKGFIKDWT